MAATTPSASNQATTSTQPEAAKAAPVQSAPPAQVTPEARLQDAQAIARRNVLWSLGAGVVPFPIVDLLAVAAVELKMLREIAKVYDVNFQEGIAKKIIGSLLASIGVVGIGGIIGGSLAKFVPGIGTTLSLLSVPVLAGAVTHATGKIFIMHFEAGGTLLDLNPKTMKAHFRKEFEKAKEVVADLQRQQSGSGAKPA